MNDMQMMMVIVLLGLGFIAVGLWRISELLANALVLLSMIARQLENMRDP